MGNNIFEIIKGGGGGGGRGLRIVRTQKMLMGYRILEMFFKQS